ncbi:MAG: ROK family protein, partial [Thermoplasmata archaeon]|nr:ROK family protein [Thermoplasmata archaeon]
MTARREDGPTLGLDIGATKIRAAIVDDSGAIVAGTAAAPLTGRSPDQVIEAVDRLVRSGFGAVAPRPGRIGVAIAAQVDRARGAVLYAPNLGWGRVALGARLGARFGVPTVLENDVRAAAYAEGRVGAARSVDQMLLLWDGTGLGGGLVVDGRLLAGARGAAGELGHLTVVTNGRKCHCPNRGCLEAYVGGWAIAERAREAVRASPRAGRKLVARSGRPSAITAQQVFLAARAGDRLSVDLLRDTEQHLAAGAVSIVNALNPSL